MAKPSRQTSNLLARQAPSQAHRFLKWTLVGGLLAGSLYFAYTNRGGEEAMSGPSNRSQLAKVYTFVVPDSQGQEVPLAQYRGKVLLIVNTASQCGFTPQYEGLQQLYRTYADRGLEILAFPCNQFGNQEPGTNREVQEFCQLHYGVTFPVFGKIVVNGEQAHPLYRYLKAQAPGTFGLQTIKWNFTKFVVDQQGNVIKRFAPSTRPKDLAPEIEKLLPPSP